MNSSERVKKYIFSDIYQLLLNKITRKNRTQVELDQVIVWLTAYTMDDLNELKVNQTCIEDFFKQAPKMNPNRFLIKGKVCGVQVELIEDEFMRDVRYLDKCVDELAKGKTLDKILRQ